MKETRRRFTTEVGGIQADLSFEGDTADITITTWDDPREGSIRKTTLILKNVSIYDITQFHAIGKKMLARRRDRLEYDRQMLANA